MASEKELYAEMQRTAAKLSIVAEHGDHTKTGLLIVKLTEIWKELRPR